MHGSDVSAPKNLKTIDSLRPSYPDVGCSKSLPSVKDGETGDFPSQTPSHASPFASGVQGGSSCPAWPRATCSTIEDLYMSPDSLYVPRPTEAFSPGLTKKLPLSVPVASIAILEEAAPLQQSRQRRQQQQQHQSPKQQQQPPKLRPSPQQHLQPSRQQQQRTQGQEARQTREQPKQPPWNPNRGGSRGAYCQARSCAEAPSYSADGHKPAVRCRDHKKEGMLRVRHDNKTCGVEGCTRDAEVMYMQQNGRIHRLCDLHKEPAVILAQAARCEHGECDGTPRYGGQDGPLAFCDAHKRAGMHTAIDGVLYVATRDGTAFRKDPSPSAAVGSGRGAKSAACAGATAAGMERATEALPGFHRKTATEPLPACNVPPSLGKDADKSPPASGKTAPLSRKLCEVPGCMIQPSYGEAGTAKPRFCTGHKAEGHVSLKNRPCISPGCTTRPHYGPSRGRPVFCATHKKKGHVHILKEAENLEKDLERKRRQKSRNIASPAKKDRLAEPMCPKKNIKRKAPADTPTKGADERQKGNNKEVKKAKKNKEDKLEKGKGPATVKGSVVGKGSAVVVARKKSVAAAGIKTAAVASTVVVATTSTRQKECKHSTESVQKVAISSSSAVRSASRTPLSSPRPASALAQKKIPGGIGRQLHLLSRTTGAAPPVLVLPGDAADSPQEGAESLGVSEATAITSCGSGGRRVRAPSRKLLEASGKVAEEGVQLLTKEKKEEENRLRMEMKEQRRAAKSAGLKLGEVIEATAVPLSFSGGQEGGSGSGSGSGSWGNGRSGGGGDAFGVDEASPSKLSWRKLSPTEILWAVQQQQQQTPKQQQQVAVAESKESLPSMKHARAEADSGAVVIAGKKRARPEGSASAAVFVEDGNTPPEKRRAGVSTAAAVAGPRHGSTTGSGSVDGGKKPKRCRSWDGNTASDGGGSGGDKDQDDLGKRRSSRGNMDDGERTVKAGGGAACGKVLCEFKGCSKPASYGIGDTARLCKMHKIVGAT